MDDFGEQNRKITIFNWRTRKMKERNIVLILVMVLVAACAVQAQIITEVVRAGGASGDRDPIGAYTADSNSLPTEAGGLIAGNYCFSDRTYHWGTPPAQLNGVEYIRTFNSDKDNQSTVTYTVTTSVAARVFVGVDERFASQDGLVLQDIIDDVVANFASPGVFTDSGMGVLIQQDGNELLIFWADLAAGTYVFQGVPGDRNFMTIGAFETAFNPIPIVDAGPDRIVWDWPGGDQLNGSVDDADPLDGPAGTLTYSWTEDAGNPTLGVIDDPGALDSTLTLSVKGTYIFTLTASDDGGTTEVTDTVTVRLKVFGEDMQTVLLVSDVADEPGNSEEPLITWLEGLDYVVDTSGMGRAFGEDGDPFDDGTEANDALLLALENANLIFFSSTVSDGEYDSNGSGPGWNAIAVPLLAQAPGLAEGQSSGGDTRFGWFLGDTRGGDDTDDMRLTPDDDSVQLWDWTDSPVFNSYWRCPDDIRTSEEKGISGGTIKAFNDGYGRRIFWLDIPKGTDFDENQASPDPGQHGIAGERRVLFGNWRYDNYNGDGATRGPGGGQAYWDSYMLPVYKTYLQQILFDLIPNPLFNPAPVVNAGPDQAGYTAEIFELDGTVSDADPITGTPGTLSFYWVQRSGPGTATFDPADTTGVEDPNVTFDAAGTYELMLQATDGTKDGNDIVSILVLEPQLVGYWPFDADALDYGENAEKSDGTLVGAPGGMPVYTAGAIGSAIDLTDVLGLEATDNHDPNLPHVALGAATELDFGITDWTVCGWVKTTQVQSAGQDDQVGKGTIFGNGGDSGGGHRYCLIVSEGGGGRVTLVVDADSNGGKFTTQTSSSRLVNNDLWHFMVGVREGNEIRVYRDGILDNTNDNLPAGYDLSGTSQVGSYIGVITDWDSDPLLLTIYKHLDGLVDDVRVYNYALSDEDIVALAGMSELPVSVDAGSDEPHQLKPGETISTAATVIDNGTPGTRNYLWETVARPADSNAIFGDKTAENTTVEFPDFGEYTLRLTVEDVNLGIFVSDEVTLTIISPTCAEVITEGLLLVGDIAGGGVLGDEPDCRVTLADVAAFAADFGRCNDPQGDCEDPWGGG